MADSEVSEELCKICSQIRGKYVCPRCNILYCSLLCYQSNIHINCSEGFYRDCVLDHIKSRDRDSHEVKKMCEILKNFQENGDDDEDLDSDDEDSIPDLHERFKNVNLDDADSVWEKLTTVERKEFHEMVRNGDASKLIAPWKPWWLYRRQIILIGEIENDDATNFNYEARCPPLKKNVASFSQISKTSPSPRIKYNVLNVLAAYCYTARFYNGEIHSTPSESSSTLVNLSSNLSHNHNYDSADIAVEAVAYEAINCAEVRGSTESVTCMKSDVDCILVGPEEENYSFYVQAALSDIYKLFTEAKRTKEKGPTGEKRSSEFRKIYSEHAAISSVPKDKMKLCIKKLEYYLSWLQDHSLRE